MIPARARPAERQDQGRDQRALAPLPAVDQGRVLGLGIHLAKAKAVPVVLVRAVLAIRAMAGALAMAVMVVSVVAGACRSARPRVGPSEMRRDSPLAAAFP